MFTECESFLFEIMYLTDHGGNGHLRHNLMLLRNDKISLKTLLNIFTNNFKSIW